MRLMQSKARGLMVLAMSLLTLQLAAAGETADKPAKPEKGKGWYVMMLWEAGTPIPGSDGTKYMKKVKEPDLAKLGGKVLRSNGNRRLIELPVTAARELRRDAAVSTLQRLWAGEPLEELKEEPYESRVRSTFETETDTNLDWGPKDYTYDGSGNIKTIGPAGAPDNYSYDTAGRLIRATVGGKTETFKYDAFGNLIEKAVAGANPEVMPVDGSSNRLIGASYDAAGNLTTQGALPEYEYDSFNMLKKTPGGRYNIYDANDERIGVIDDDQSRWWIQDLEGRVIREFTSTNLEHDLNWFWQHDYVYAGGHLVGGEKVQWKYVDERLRETWFGGKRHYHLDHLGSVRVVTDDDGRSVSEHDYYAFGVSPTKAYQEEMNFGNPSIDSMRFAGHQRDNLGWLNIENTDYLDYMHARFYDPNLGRFLSVDPGDDAYLSQPQSWNKYSYVRNNPVRFVDPTGLRCQPGEQIGADGCGSDVTAVDPGPSFSMNGFLGGFSNSRQLDRFSPRTTMYAAYKNSGNTVWSRFGEFMAPDDAEDAVIELGMVLIPFGKIAKPFKTPAMSAIRRALAKVHLKVGRLPKGRVGKFGSPQRGTPKKGYRLDPPHPNREPWDPESKWHFNWWDYTKGKKGPGVSGVIPIE